MSHKIEFTPSGEREFNKLSHQLQQRITEKINLYISSGNPLSFAKPLVNFPPATHRFRVGKYRVCFYIENFNIIIDSVDKREDAYKRN
ncbi:MAG: type II toxin-antitoxin system RelE/ParE family toxin [Candidatus Omnitrophota bacterium]